jgi:hypothetical protein
LWLVSCRGWITSIAQSPAIQHTRVTAWQVLISRCPSDRRIPIIGLTTKALVGAA